MLYALIESADRTPLGGKAFPQTKEGLAAAISHGADIAAENSTVSRKLVTAGLTRCGVFEEGDWSVRIIPLNYQ